MVLGHLLGRMTLKWKMETWYKVMGFPDYLCTYIAGRLQDLKDCTMFELIDQESKQLIWF
jgi:hypothetical protein